MSGSFVLRSGVGTQMLIVSSSVTTAKSVVASSLPASVSVLTSAVVTSGMYERPSLMVLIFRTSRSIPVAWNPALASSTASGNPTYPRPTTPVRARRVVSFSRSAAASADMRNLTPGEIPDENKYGTSGCSVRIADRPAKDLANQSRLMEHSLILLSSVL